jgi:hypothetical protein
MPKYVPPLKHFLVIALIAIGTGAGVYFAISDEAPPAPSEAVVAPIVAEPAVPQRLSSPRTKDDAMIALMELPELKAWNAYLEKTSGGIVRGALIEYGPTPKSINGKSYWQISYVQNSPDAAQRWESFLVSETDTEILVEDDESDVPLTLEQWRAEKKPMERTSAL